MTELFEAIEPVLVERFAHGNGTIFVGAGISLGAKMPSWAELMEPLRHDLGKEVGPSTNFLEIAELYEIKHSRGVLIQYLKEKLGDVRYQLTQTHELIVSLPVQRIYTTNFDSLLEQASRKKQINRNVIFNASHVGFSDTSTLSIVKLHGDLDDADSLVISARDYYRYFSRNPAVADLLKVELQTHTVLFLGYSFSDPNLGMILGKVAAQSGPVRPLLYCLQLMPGKLATQALHERGVKVIPIKAEPGTLEASEAIEEWLRCFRKALIRCDRRRSGQHRASNGVPGRFTAPPTSHFLYRSETRGRIEAGLQSDFRVVVVKGEAGVGKTMLVAAAVADFLQQTGVIAVSDSFEQVIWMNCDDPQIGQQLERILDTIAISLDAFSVTATCDANAADTPELRLKKKVLRVNQLLQERKVIVVLEDLSAGATKIKAWLENPGPYANPKSRIIVTSRDVALTGFVVEVARLSDEDAIDLVRERAHSLMLKRDLPGGLGSALIRRIVEETGGNPQAIYMAVGLLNGSGREAFDALPRANTSKNGIEPLFALYTEHIWNALASEREGKKSSAGPILCAMLAFPAMVPAPSRLLRRAAELDEISFREGVEQAARYGILERDVANDTFNMQRIPRACLSELVKDNGCVNTAAKRLHEHLLEFLSDENVLRRPSISDRYWNTLVRAEMAKVDPYWPIIEHVMRRAVKAETVGKFVELLTHYMDSRFLNAERVEFILAALNEFKGQDPLLEATLRIDALAWTYIEERAHQKARAEIDSGLRLLSPGSSHDLRALADAWRARMMGAEKKFLEATKFIKSAIVHARSVPDRHWIRMRVEMMAGDVRMMQDIPIKALTHYRRAESLTERYGGEGNGYQTAPRIGLALLKRKRDDQAAPLFHMLKDNAKVAVGRLYGEYGLALIAARADATQEALQRLEQIYREIARRGGENVIMVLAKGLYEEISSAGPASRQSGGGTQ